MMDTHEHRAYRRENAMGFIGAANQRGVAARAGGGIPNLRRAGRGFPPALRAVPFNELLSRKRKRAGNRGYRQAPQRLTARQACIVEQQELIALLPYSAPQGL